MTYEVATMSRFYQLKKEGKTKNSGLLPRITELGVGKARFETGTTTAFKCHCFFCLSRGSIAVTLSYFLHADM